MKKHILPLFWCFIIITSSVKPAKEEASRTGLKELYVQIDQEPKPILTDPFTDWFQLCKVMDKKIYVNQNVTNYPEINSYTITSNTRTRQGLSWAEKMYQFKGSFYLRELAMFAINSQAVFPGTVSIANKRSVPASITGSPKPGLSELALKHYADECYLSSTFPATKNNYQIHGDHYMK